MSKDIRAKLEVKGTNVIILAYRRQWYDSLQRMTGGRLPKAALKYEASGRSDVGRPRITWGLNEFYII